MIATNDSIISYFIEFISQLDIDNVTEDDFDRAIRNCYFNLDNFPPSALTELWSQAFMSVGHP